MNREAEAKAIDFASHLLTELTGGRSSKAEGARTYQAAMVAWAIDGGERLPSPLGKLDLMDWDVGQSVGEALWVESLHPDARPRLAFREAAVAELLDAAPEDSDAAAAVRRIAALMLDAGQELPARLRSYIARILPRLEKPTGGRHKWRDGFVGRDLAIALAVEAVVERFELMPERTKEGRKGTRNRPSSACSVVAAAVGRAGLGSVAEGQIGDIWRDVRRRHWGERAEPGRRAG